MGRSFGSLTLSMKSMGLARRVWERYRGATDSLLGLRRGLHITGRREAAFLRAMQEAFAYHFLRNPELQRLCEDTGFYPWHLRRSEQIPEIPYFFSTCLAYHPVRSVPEQEVVLTLRACEQSVGAVGYDRTSLRRLQRIVRHIYGDLEMVDRVRANYLSLHCHGKEPGVGVAAFLDNLLSRLTRINHFSRFGEDLDGRELSHLLERYEASGRPFRLLGSPTQISSALTRVMESRQGRPFRFGPRSYALVTSWWSRFERRPAVREEVSRGLGIPASNVRAFWGTLEHGVPCCECENQKLHVSLYSRVYVRDPISLQMLAPGSEGLLHFVTPFHHSYPAISLLTTKRGRLLEGCRCGRASPVLELLEAGAH